MDMAATPDPSAAPQVPERRRVDRRKAEQMACPHCKQRLSCILDSRPHPYRDSVWRMRQCSNCNERFETEEALIPKIVPA